VPQVFGGFVLLINEVVIYYSVRCAERERGGGREENDKVSL